MEYLTQIPDAKARQFYSLYSDQRTNFNKTDQFEVPNCQVYKYLTIIINLSLGDQTLFYKSLTSKGRQPQV
jgi:hypothetical protein